MILNMQKLKLKNQQAGFIDIIIAIIIIFLIMKYFGLTITGMFEWVKNLFYSIW